MSARRWPQLPPVRPSLRPSVRSTSSPPPPPQPGRPGPAQRRPEQPRPCEETGAAPARPCPAPVLPSVCASVRPSVRRPPALRPSCPAVSFPASVPASPALSLPGSLSLCLYPRASFGSSLPSRSLVSPRNPLFLSFPSWLPPFFGSPPHSAPRSFGASPSEHSPRPPPASRTSSGGPPFNLYPPVPGASPPLSPQEFPPSGCPPYLPGLPRCLRVSFRTPIIFPAL